jgi:hypothetical protein
MSKKRYKKREERKRKKGTQPPSRAPALRVSLLEGRLFDLTVMAVYLILVAILFHQFLFSSGMLYGTDSMQSGVFFRGLYRDFVREYHTLPRWDPYILGGLPFIDAMHGDTFYPTSLLKFFMPLHRAMGWKLVLHVFLAGLFMYLFLKSIKLNRYSAAFGGLCYMFASVFVSLVYAGHDAKMFVIALLPLCFYLLEKGFEGRRLFPFVMLGGAIGLLILSSHVQMAYFALWAIGLYLLFRLVLLWRDGNVPKIVVGKMVVYFGLAVLLGLGFGLVQLLPSYVFVNNYSVREEKTGFDHATSWSLHVEEVGSLVVPEFSGDSIEEPDTYWGRNFFKLNTEYIGLIPLLVAAFALIAVRSKRVLFFSICALLAVIYGLGGDTPIFYLFYSLVPGVKLFRGPSMIMFLFSFAVCIVAAIGFSALVENTIEKRKREKLSRRMVVGFGLVLGVGFLIAVMGGGFFSVWTNLLYDGITAAKRNAMLANLSRFTSGLWIALFLIAAGGGLMWARLKKKISPSLFLILMVPLVLIDTWRIDGRFIKVVNPNEYIGRDRITQFLKQQEATSGPFRVFSVGRAYGENLLGVHRIESVTGFHDNELKWYNAFTGRDRRNLFQLPFLDLLNVKYVLWNPKETMFQGYFSQLVGGGRLKEVFNDGRIIVMQNTGVLPRAWVASDYEVTDSTGVFERLADPTFNYRTTVLLDEDPGVALGRADSLTAGRVERIVYEGNSLELQVVMNSPGFVVLSDNYFPYWHVHVDGVEQKIYRAYHALRAVYLEPGAHSVVFTYRSRPFELGSWISGLTFVLLCGAALVELGWKKRKRRRDA